MEWWCAGLGWPDGRPVLRWERGAARAEGRASSLVYGTGIAFRAVGERGCVGARGNPCPHGAVVPGAATQARCPECARLDRAHSVAADTLADDPRTYRVYLAWFGAGLVKVGITREERGAARLLEQGAVAFSWLGRGPLMAARRTEELLRAALGVPDRIPYAQKRAVRAAVLSGAGGFAGELVRMHARAVALGGWPDSLERLPCEVVDHVREFGIDGLPVAGGVVSGLVDGVAVAGRLVAAAGPDLHLVEEGVGGRALVLDTRLLVGWRLGGAAGAVRTTAGVREVPGVQGGLF
ncbi:DUF2797 domain-containing protein [Actinomycetota bacterium Odt1-20B]